jgi:DNA primase
MNKFELQKLRDLPIEGVAERLGLQVKMHKALCPFHADNHPSLSFSVRRNTFRCFVCGASGGTIDLVMKHLNKDFSEYYLTTQRKSPPDTP